MDTTAPEPLRNRGEPSAAPACGGGGALEAEEPGFQGPPKARGWDDSSREPGSLGPRQVTSWCWVACHHGGALGPGQAVAGGHPCGTRQQHQAAAPRHVPIWGRLLRVREASAVSCVPHTSPAIAAAAPRTMAMVMSIWEAGKSHQFLNNSSPPTQGQIPHHTKSHCLNAVHTSKPPEKFWEADLATSMLFRGLLVRPSAESTTSLFSAENTPSRNCSARAQGPASPRARVTECRVGRNPRSPAVTPVSPQDLRDPSSH